METCSCGLQEHFSNGGGLWTFLKLMTSIGYGLDDKRGLSLSDGDIVFTNSFFIAFTVFKTGMVVNHRVDSKLSHIFPGNNLPTRIVPNMRLLAFH